MNTTLIAEQNRVKFPEPTTPLPVRVRGFGWNHQIVLGLVLACSAYLALKGLDNSVFWDDEAQVGIFARNFLHTGELTAWDGRNFYGYRNGRVLDAQMHTVHPPLMFWVCAASFKIFGETTWAGRFPFALAGLAALVVLALLLRLDFGANRRTWLYALGSVGLTPVYLLYIRQCRYFALSIFFAVGIYYGYRMWVARGRPGMLAWMTGCAILMYYANYMQGMAFVAAVGVAALLCERKALDRRRWLGLAAAGALFLLATIPHAMAQKIWIRAEDIFVTEPWLTRHLHLLWWNFRDLNAMGALPWTLGLGVAWVLFRNAPGETRQPAMRRWAVLVAAHVFFIALFSPQSTGTWFRNADHRYLTATLPFLLPLGGLFLAWLHERAPWTAAGLFLVSLASTLPGVTLANPRPRWLPPAYCYEIHHPYQTAFGEVVEFLKDKTEPEDLVATWIEEKIYPLMFYAGHRNRFGPSIFPDSPLAATVAKLDGPVLVENYYPKWIIVFDMNEGAKKMMEIYAWPHDEGGRQVQYSYEPAWVLDVYHRETQRPELPLHEFRPVRDFNRDTDAVYVFRRKENPANVSETLP